MSGSATDAPLELCGARWVGHDDKDHQCAELEGHDGKCRCSCGNRQRVANRFLKWEPKPFYKRRKAERKPV